ncbi:oligoribonuclease [Candidatus Dependentiae bacterium]|nr:MAG: oligoribonuclease [Candidatus Dependentiae bacterium]
MNKKDNLVWIDLEMTGLSLEKDVILEIASIVTDKDLNVLAHGPSLSIHHSDVVLEEMNSVVAEFHRKSGLLEEVRHSAINLQDAEQQTLDFIREYCLPEVAPLCGNSIWQDRAFLRIYMPRLLSYLHYRLIDVTSFKEIIMRWYPEDPHAFFEKRDAHRALDDIKESIAELNHYRKYFLVS